MYCCVRRILGLIAYTACMRATMKHSYRNLRWRSLLWLHWYIPERKKSAQSMAFLARLLFTKKIIVRYFTLLKRLSILHIYHVPFYLVWMHSVCISMSKICRNISNHFSWSYSIMHYHFFEKPNIIRWPRRWSSFTGYKFEIKFENKFVEQDQVYTISPVSTL